MRYRWVLIAVILLLFVSSASAAYLDYYAYGDSVTRATSYGDLPADGSACYILQMRNAWDPSATADHNSDGGGKTADWGRLNLASHWNADGIGTIVIAFGLNDMGLGISASDCADDLIEMYNYSIAQGARCIIAIQPLITDDGVTPWKSLENQTAYIRSIESDLNTLNIPFVRFYDAIDTIKHNTIPEEVDTAEYATGGTHPDTSGHKKMGDLVWGGIVNEWWWKGFDHKKTVSLTGDTGWSDNQTYYQVMLNLYNTTGVDSGNDCYLGTVQPDFDDVRFTFTDDGVPVDFWHEGYLTDNMSTWCELPIIYKSTITNLTIWYGNSTETGASNGDNTFPSLFDHFNSASLDTTKWTLGGGTATLSGSIVDFYNATVISYATSKSTYGVNTSLRHNGSIDYSINYIGDVYYRSSSSINLGYLGSTQLIARTRNGTSTDTLLGTGYTGYHLFEASRSSTTTVNFSIDNNLISTHTTNISAASMNVRLASSIAKHLPLDWILIRKYVSPEPLFSTWGDEETAPCTASFTGTQLSGCTPLSVQFTDASTTGSGTIVNWSWNFGDGNTSFEQNPLHIYIYTGTYDVNLTITNSLGSTSYLNRTAYVDGTYTSNFSANVTEGMPTFVVNFTDSSCNTSTGWYWEFGNGDTNATQNPVYTYDDVIGDTITSFNVSLNTTNLFEYDWENKTAYITLYPLNTNFVGVPTSGSNPLTVSFTSSITNGTATTWDWDFGDGSPHSSLQNPSHTYTSNGDYTVSLNASNAYSYDWENKTTYISVSTPGSPTANFHGTPTSGTVPLTVTFFDDSTGSPTSWNWSFGDGQFSTLQNPVHTYSAVGVYTVSLNATNVFGSDVAQANDYIAVTAAPTPTQTPSNATGGTRGYSAEETAIPFWLWAVIIILGSALLIAGLFGRHLIFGIMSTMCFAAAAFASPMVSFFYQEVVLSNESEVAYSVFPMKWLVTQPWVAWLLWGMALLALLVVVYGVIVGMAEIKKPGDEFLEDDWLDKRDF